MRFERILKWIFMKMTAPVEFYMFKFIWRKKNPHNLTSAGIVFPIDRVNVGKGTYGTINISNAQDPNGNLKIGNYCSIADGVIFLLSGEHNYNCFSTYPFLHRVCGQRIEAKTKGNIIVGDDVWLGLNVIVLSGVTIGQGCIIGAGTIVSKSIPPYAIFAGGRIIKYRFSNEVIEKLLMIDFSRIDSNLIKENIDLIYNEDICRFLESALYQQLTS